MTTTLRRSILGLGTLCLVTTTPLACGFNTSGLETTGWGGGTHSTTHSSSGGGAPPSCNPGESIICYTGPIGTAGKGICTAGSKICNDDGMTYGPCNGEVTPKAEDCSTSLDENCDGTVNEMCPCEPGTTEACYTGPAGTENVGICKGSTHTCKPDGMGFGPCTGEVTPKTEDCTTPDDEDCDGIAFGAAGSACKCAIGTMTACSTGLQGVCAMGTQTCAGDANASDYGACTPNTQPSTENCATPDDESCDGQGSCTGSLLLAKIAGTPTTKDDVAFAATFDTSGNLIAGGVINGTYGSSGVTEGAFWLAKYTALGAVAWEKTVAPTGNPAYAVVFGVATDAMGNVYAAGEYQGVLGFGNGVSITSDGTGTGIDGFLVKLDATGVAQWAKSFTGGAIQSASSVAVDSAGNVIVAGGMQGTADFGGGPITSAGSFDAFVAKFDGAGTHLWSKAKGDGGFQFAWAVAAAPNGDVVLVGEVDGHLNFGTDLNAGNDRDAFVVRLKGDGSHVWSKMFGDPADQAAYGVAVDSAGNVVITGGFEGNINFGGNNVTSTNSTSTTDVFVAKLAAADGGHIWSKGYGSANDQFGSRVAVDALGNVLVTGSFEGTINFGGSTLTNPDTTNATFDIFAAKLGPDGSHVWSASGGDTMDQSGWDVAVDKLGNVAIAGGFQGTVAFGAPVGSLMSQGGYDIFAAKLMP